jgi:hypothetical protein
MRIIRSDVRTLSKFGERCGDAIIGYLKLINTLRYAIAGRLSRNTLKPSCAVLVITVKDIFSVAFIIS